MMYATLTNRLETIVVERAGPVAFLTLDRPDARNAMNSTMIAEITRFFADIRDDRTIRCVVLRGSGDCFCAGADIKEMRDPVSQTREAQLAYAAALDAMLRAVQEAPQVVIAAVEGAAMGGGLGLTCVSDIAVADESAILALPEVRLGIAPAVISPYVVARIGLTQARRLALTGRRLNGYGAQEIGLVHDVAAEGTLESIIDGYVRDVLQGSPEALAATKALLFHVAGTAPDENRAYRVELLSQLRASADGVEGMAAFAQKRPPAWVPSEEPAEVALLNGHASPNGHTP